MKKKATFSFFFKVRTLSSSCQDAQWTFMDHLNVINVDHEAFLYRARPITSRSTLYVMRINVEMFKILR